MQYCDKFYCPVMHMSLNQIEYALQCVSANIIIIITFRVICRRREMYCGHTRLCVSVCVSVCLRPHAHTIAWIRM